MPDDTFSTQENTVDSTVNTEQQGDCSTSFKLLPAILTPNGQINSCYLLSADLNSGLQSEVPDWSMSIEIGSWNTLNNRFEVSPMHSPGKTTTQMAQLLNQDSGMIDLIE